MRRLGLGLELVSDPECLICDEVTSGLDPLSEDQIIELLRSLVESQGKTFLCTIHNLGKLPDFDHITVPIKAASSFRVISPHSPHGLRSPTPYASITHSQDSP
jgi:energy-coupling factor transporter ATP-binding protein EcfA2